MKWNGIERRAKRTSPGTPTINDPFGQIPDPPDFVAPPREVWSIHRRAGYRFGLLVNGMSHRLKPGLEAQIRALLESP